MLDFPDHDTQLILERLYREGHIIMEEDGKHFRVTSEKYAFLKNLDDGPYPYFCIFLSDKPAEITEADMAWARSVAERISEEMSV